VVDRRLEVAALFEHVGEEACLVGGTNRLTSEPFNRDRSFAMPNFNQLIACCVDPISNVPQQCGATLPTE
jgi:hypothetical protein